MKRAVVFDVGRVLVQWQLRALFEKLIDDEAELDWFLANVVTEEWHFQSDRGRPLAEMVRERALEFPDHAHLVRAYAARFPETVPGPIEGSMELVERLHDGGVPIFGLTNFGHEFWQVFRASQPVFDLFDDVIVSGTESSFHLFQILKPSLRQQTKPWQLLISIACLTKN